MKTFSDPGNWSLTPELLVLVLCLLLHPELLMAAESRPPDFGATREDFAVGPAQSKAFILLPTNSAPQAACPWVWYAPTLGLPNSAFPNVQQHGWLFRQLLTNGFAIAGVDAGESYGSPVGCAVFSAFHARVVERYKLSAKACLLPQSRGGLMLLNWASEHPELVQCIGGIYPVCDLTSYPGLARACSAYGLDEAGLTQRLSEFNPPTRVAPLARARIPILFVHGDADKVVPLERNSGLFASRYREAGGEIELAVIPGKGHDNSPEFFRSQRLLEFFLRHRQ